MLACVFLILVNTTAIVAMLFALGLWSTALLKDTVAWFFVVGMVMMIRFVPATDTKGLFKKVVVDNFKAVILLEFLVNTYVFSLPVEFVIVPIVATIAAVSAFASLDKEYAAVETLCNVMLGFMGLAVLAIAVVRAVLDLHTLGSWDTVTKITLAPALSLSLLPLMYLMMLAANYEGLFLLIDLGAEKGKYLRRYARRRILVHAGLSFGRIRQLRRNFMLDIMHIRTESDVDRILERAKDTSFPSASEEQEEESADTA
jgi:hypothetical protein